MDTELVFFCDGDSSVLSVEEKTFIELTSGWISLGAGFTSFGNGLGVEEIATELVAICEDVFFGKSLGTSVLIGDGEIFTTLDSG